ncbi:MAG: tetratricopeptide repeat protein [Trichodesmium sp. St4_bin8_1]|nr:tetratricopeptide repeat protein [Trichodesmium sp. St4_bin8_1]
MKIIKGNRVKELRNFFCNQSLIISRKKIGWKIWGFRPNDNYFEKGYKGFTLSLLRLVSTLILTVIVSMSDSIAYGQNQNFDNYQKRKSLIFLSQNQEQVEDFKLREEIRDGVREEVDYTFRHATSLLSVFLIVLTFFPASAAVWIWFLQAKLAHKVDVTKQEIDSFKYDTVSQLKQIIVDTQVILDELRVESGKAEEKIEQLQQDTLIQFSSEQGDNSEPLMMAKDYAKKADTFFFSGQFKEAINAYNQALKIHPKMADVWNNRGVALTRLKIFDEAISSYDRALQIRADYADAWNNRGVCLAKIQKYQEAVKSYNQAIAIKNDYGDAWNNRGACLMKLGIYGEAIACFDNAVKIQPDFFSAWYNQARCYSLKGDVDMALKSFEKAVSLNGKKSQKMAKNEPDFDNIRDHELFQKLIV